MGLQETTSLENGSIHPSRGMISYQVNITGSGQELKNTHDVQACQNSQGRRWGRWGRDNPSMKMSLPGFMSSSNLPRIDQWWVTILTSSEPQGDHWIMEIKPGGFSLDSDDNQKHFSYPISPHTYSFDEVTYWGLARLRTIARLQISPASSKGITTLYLHNSVHSAIHFENIWMSPMCQHKTKIPAFKELISLESNK